MSIRQQNLEYIGQVAKALGDMNDKVVYVGGAVMSFYVTDPAAPDVRPTNDVDIFLEIMSLSKLEDIREQLMLKGFTQSPKDDILCRFRYKGIK